jgi:NAD(P)-dependent dehydrogenase (short-subunit alcohol dehydrogenase family)
VNCAGIANAFRTASRSAAGQVRHFPLADFDRIIQVNLVGTFRCIAKSAAGMLTLEPGESGERGSIVNTASIAAEDGQRGQAAYSASKAAVVGMTLPIARDLMREGIRINTIMPGGFETPLLQSAPDKVRAALDAIDRFPFRMGEPDEFASLAESMLTNAYLNGSSVRLDAAARMTAD